MTNWQTLREIHLPPCTYCGAPADTRDHVPPLSYAPHSTVTVPACALCNAWLNDKFLMSVDSRREWIQAEIERREAAKAQCVPRIVKKARSYAVR